MAAVRCRCSRLPSGDLVNQRLDLRPTMLFLVHLGDLLTPHQPHAYVILYCCLIAMPFLCVLVSVIET